VVGVTSTKAVSVDRDGSLLQMRMRDERGGIPVAVMEEQTEQLEQFERA